MTLFKFLRQFVLGQLLISVELDLMLEIGIGVFAIGSLGRLEFDALKLSVLFEHLAEGLFGLCAPGLGLVLLEGELFQALVGFKELSHGIQAVITDDANMQLMHMLVVVNGLKETIEAGVLKAHVLEGKPGEWVVWVGEKGLTQEVTGL